MSELLIDEVLLLLRARPLLPRTIQHRLNVKHRVQVGGHQLLLEEYVVIGMRVGQDVLAVPIRLQVGTRRVPSAIIVIVVAFVLLLVSVFVVYIFPIIITIIISSGGANQLTRRQIRWALNPLNDVQHTSLCRHTHSSSVVGGYQWPVLGLCIHRPHCLPSIHC